MTPSAFLGIVICTVGLLGLLLLPFSFVHGTGLIVLSAATATYLAKHSL